MKRATQLAGISAALGLLVLSSGAGCVAEDPGSDVNNLVQEKRVFSGHTELLVPLADSPSGGAEFNFCTEVPAGEFDSNQAAWLGFFAANEYAHFGYVGPMLVEMGFGNANPEKENWTGGLDYIWDECGIDLDLVRADHDTNETELKRLKKAGPDALINYVEERLVPGQPSGWGECAERWYELSGWDATTLPAPALEQWLIQTYHPGDNIQFFSGGEFEMEGTFFNEGTTQVQFMRHSKLPVAIISFRGTDKWLDVVTDASAWQVPYSRGGNVHSGFLNAYETVGLFLQEAVADLAGTGVEIYITGPSLGGSLATLFTRKLLELKDEGADIEVGGMYNMGSPRVGDETFSQQFDALAAKHGVNVMRVRNADDVVTRIPSTASWSHVERLVYLTEDALALPDEIPEYSWLGSVADHSVTTYFLRLAKHMRAPKYAAYQHCR